MLSFTFGRRRRRVSVFQTGKTVAAAQASPTQPPRQILPKIVRAPYRPARITVLKTRSAVAGTFQGARPQVIVVRCPQPKRIPQPIIARTRPLPNILPPPIDRWQPRPLVAWDYSRQGRWKPIQVRTGPIRVPTPPIPRPALVGYWRAGPPAIRPRIYSTRPIGATITRLPTTVSVRLPIIPWRIRPVTNLRSHAQSTAPPTAKIIRIIVARRPAALPWRKYHVFTSTQTIRQPRAPVPLIIPIPRRVAPARPSIRASSAATAIARVVSLPLQPMVTARPRRIYWPSAVQPAARYLLSSPAQHGPIPRTFIIRRPRLFDFRQSAQYRTLSTGSPYPINGPNNPAIPGVPTLPPDLVAACIAWLRQQPAIVTAFSDSATTPKFGSDISPRDTNPPWLDFFEPDEEEGYESVDYTGQPSSLCDGTLGIELVGTGKLAVRLLADQVAAVLNDAPLVFQDGVLVYLRRTKRKYPSFREAGPGTNVVLYKRYLEFDYKIERWDPAF
jgi:hypothetical protein